jgi:amidase
LTELAWLSGKQLAARIRRGELSSLEALDAAIARMERLNPAINAIVATDVPRARRQAKAADRARAKGVTLGPLHGVPMTVKESFDVAGMATTIGFVEHRGNLPAQDSLVVQRLAAAGAIVFGKTNLPVAMADWQSFNPVYGTTNNPWDPTRVPGGSSGGSAAALAAGLTPLEFGSDIGASIRNPAHYCGVFGHKPTIGIVPSRGHGLPPYVHDRDIAACGPLARTAADLRLLLEATAGADPAWQAGWQVALPASKRRTLEGLRVGVLLSAPTADVDRGVQDVLATLARAMKSAGAKVDLAPELPFDLADNHNTYFMLLRAATSGSVTDAQVAQAAKRRPRVRDDDWSYPAMLARAWTLSQRDWHHWNERRLAQTEGWMRWFGRYDVMLCPTASTTAFPHRQTGERWERMLDVNGVPQPSTTQMFWAGLGAVCGLPATVLPAGLAADGLPVGAQLIGARGADLDLLAIAGLLEREGFKFRAPPGFD